MEEEMLKYTGTYCTVLFALFMFESDSNNKLKMGGRGKQI